MIRRPFWVDLRHKTFSPVIIQPIGERRDEIVAIDDIVEIMSIDETQGLLALASLPEDYFNEIVKYELRRRIKRGMQAEQKRRERANCLNTLDKITFT